MFILRALSVLIALIFFANLVAERLSPQARSRDGGFADGLTRAVEAALAAKEAMLALNAVAERGDGGAGAGNTSFHPSRLARLLARAHAQTTTDDALLRAKLEALAAAVALARVDHVGGNGGRCPQITGAGAVNVRDGVSSCLCTSNCYNVGC